MEIDEKLIRHVAGLARIRLSDEEVKVFVPQLKEALLHFEVIRECDTEGIKPSFQPIEIRNKLREDIPKESLSKDDALKNSEHTRDGYFKGPGAL